ncbi:monooxygenase [Aeromonas simiae]|uniref:Monooxygenase n=1 Tax=Aeromonas simiae TaxID=218936 RepID=A0A5J6X103_9GAMM|nr:monooxygenase [Aeromonas simiae]MDO2950394.1 monooxygenase [Aeromonas simiae]MDO2954075.1 monooxygenase [Aeromonas simiae]MDO2957807.1 monooxygenase [Aeromonas simiae]QFI56027.1 monooxygenase [Aeromonas simiae]
MTTLLQIHFDFPADMMGPSLASAALPLAESITHEPGFISKIWTENPQTGEAGGIYLFDNEEHARAYVTMHEQRVLAMGARNVQYKLFDVNEELSRVTFGLHDK